MKQHVTIRELTEMLSVSRSTLHRMKQSGELPAAINLERRVVRWSRKDIELWLELDCPSEVQFRKLKRRNRLSSQN